MLKNRKKGVTVVLLVLFCLNFSILLQTYLNSTTKIELKEPQSTHLPRNINLALADSKKPLGSDTFSKVRPILQENQIDFGKIRTDVDRKEDQMKNKRKLKLQRNFEKKCKENQKFCKDLEQFLAQDDYQFVSYDLDAPTVKYHAEGKQNISMKQQLPQILIIGAKKAGTRALLAFLSLHPCIKSPGPELHFFDRFFYRGTTWYKSQLPYSKEGQLTVEKTPAYFVDKDVPVRVQKTIPNVKLLLVVRDPVIRAISDYAQGVSKRGVRPKFEDLALKNASTGMVNVAWGPIRGGLYSKHLQRWLKVFPRSTIHVVSGEGLVKNPAKEMDKVQKFLNLERLITEKNFYFNATKGFPCIVKPLRSGTPNCLGFSKGRTHPTVNNDTLQILKEFYRPFNNRFYRLVDQDFGW